MVMTNVHVLHALVLYRDLLKPFPLFLSVVPTPASLNRDIAVWKLSSLNCPYYERRSLNIMKCGRGMWWVLPSRPLRGTTPQIPWGTCSVVEGLDDDLCRLHGTANGRKSYGIYNVTV